MKFLILLLVFPIYTLQAQDIASLEPNSSISTESPEVVVIIAPPMVLVGESGALVEKPNMDVVVKPMNPYIRPGEFSAEFIENLILGQTKTAIKRGLLPEKTVIKRLYSRKSAQEDLELYSMTIALHQRAILEGRDVNYYLDQVEAGKISLARLKRDIELCGLGFEIYPDSNICSKFPEHQTAEQHYYHCEKENGILKAELIKVTKPVEKTCNDLGWNSTNIWKPKADGRPSDAVVVLDKKYCNGSGQSSVSNFRVEDALGGQSASVYFRECDDGNGGRLHMGIKPEGSKIQGPAFVRYTFNGVEECRRVGDPSQRQD